MARNAYRLKIMFKNLTIYEIIGKVASYDAVNDAADVNPFVETGATQEKSSGWVPPRGEDHGAFVESVAGQWIMRFKTEERVIPGSTMQRHMQQKIDAYEKESGFKPGKKLIREMRDDAKLDLLPNAVIRQKATWVWIDKKAKRLYIDTATQSRADAIVTLLVETVKGMALRLLSTENSPQSAMAHWLMTQEPPTGFDIGRECELKACDESKAIVRYKNHPLDIDEVREHVEHGKLPTKLALCYDDRLSFALTSNLTITGIRLLDTVMTDADPEEDVFDTNVAIFTGEMQRLIPDLIEALGGELYEEEDDPAADL